MSQLLLHLEDSRVAEHLTARVQVVMAAVEEVMAACQEVTAMGAERE